MPFVFEDLGVENAMEGAFLAGDMAVVKTGWDSMAAYESIQE